MCISKIPRGGEKRIKREGEKPRVGRELNEEKEEKQGTK